jgi:hypothetical protein
VAASKKKVSPWLQRPQAHHKWGGSRCGKVHMRAIQAARVLHSCFRRSEPQRLPHQATESHKWQKQRRQARRSENRAPTSHKGNVYVGEHETIIDDKTWDKV